MKKLIFGILFSIQLMNADSLSVGLLGLSSHATGVSNRDWGTMKRKISRTGYLVWNPEINVTYEHNGWLINGTYVNDCKGDNSYFLGAGYRWSASHTLHVSLLAGAYYVKQYYYRGEVFEHTERKVTFLPWVSIEKDFMFTEALGAFVSVNSNYALTHAVTGLKWKF